MLDCRQKPVAPISWTFRHLPDSEAQLLVTEGSVVSDYAHRYGIHGSKLIIHKVRLNDAGLYNCSDANGDILTYKVAVDGEEIAVIFLPM